MYSLILTTATKYALPLLLIFSIFLLLRGHNSPGGGFVGGLVAAAATFAFYSFAYSVEEAQKALRANPIRLIGVGLLIAVSSAIYPLTLGFAVYDWHMGQNKLSRNRRNGTPFIFDIGVYLVVVGVVLLIVFSLKEAESE